MINIYILMRSNTKKKELYFRIMKQNILFYYLLFLFFSFDFFYFI